MKIYREESPKGMTLLENAIALMVIGIVIMGLTQLFITVPMYAKIANHKVSSMNLIQDKIEELKSLGYDGIVTGVYPVEAVVIDAFKPDDASDDLNGLRSTSVIGITNGKKIIVDVSWSEFDKEFNELAEMAVRKLD